MVDLLLKNSEIVNGTGAKRLLADVAVKDGRISKIAPGLDVQASEVVDLSGKILAPGFIDVHTHSDGWLLKEKNFFAKSRQGFTTEVIMADGISYAPVTNANVNDWFYYLRALNALRIEDYRGWSTLKEFIHELDGQTAQNFATHVPYANIRSKVLGFSNRRPLKKDIREIQREIETCMTVGAVGLSNGLEYISESFADTDELVASCEPMSNTNGLYVTHIRYPIGVVAGLKEAVEVGKRAKVPVHISHLKAVTPGQAEEILNYIDTVAVNEVDFSFDVYPYTASSTLLSYMLPYDVWRDGPLAVRGKLSDSAVINGFAKELSNYPLDQTFIAWLPGNIYSEWIGKSLEQFVNASEQETTIALLELLQAEDFAVLLVFRRGDDSAVCPFLQHEKFMLGTDGVYHPSAAVHPRMHGSPARLLGDCVRDKKLFTLESAIFKMTGYPANRFGLENRGVIREGAFADFVVFDEHAIADRASYSEPNEASVGIDAVYVNGKKIVESDTAVTFDTATPPGSFLRSTNL